MCGIVILLYLMSHLALSSGNVAPKTGICALNECSTSDGCPIIKSNLLTTLPTLNKEFFVSVEFKATAWQSSPQSVIHFTEDGDCCKVGQRVPALWVGNSGQVYPRFAVNGTGDYFIGITKQYPLNQWITVQFSQTLENGTYIYRVLINGKSEIEVVNSQPKIFSNIKVYSSDPWYKALRGSIRNLIVNADGSKNCGACTDGEVATAVCKCGTEDCSVGEICSAAASTCITPPPACTDGAEATSACKCGTEDCLVGDTCSAAASTCKTPPPACADGAVATAACKCGTEDCLVGDTCSEASSTCTTPLPVCDDNGCDKAYDGKEGKGICVPINIDDWNVINKDIDFTAPMKTGLCKSSGNTGCCGCFKQKLDKCEDKRCVPIPKKKIHRECFKKGKDVKPNMFNTGKMCAKRKDCYCYQNCKTPKKCKKSGGQCLGSPPKWPYQIVLKPCDKKKKCKCYIPIST